MSEQIIDLGKLVEPLDYTRYLGVSRGLPVVRHEYGKTMPLLDSPYRLDYISPDTNQPSISFTQNTYKNIDLLPMTYKIAEVLQSVFVPEFVIDFTRVHFMMTRGNIKPHRDEAGRKCCINIGLYHSDKAITLCTTDDKFDTFRTNHTKHIVEPGHAYLLNTGAIHAVRGPQEIERAMFTYGFGLPFAEIKSKLRINQ